jgi:hypothetical protein
MLQDLGGLGESVLLCDLSLLVLGFLPHDSMHMPSEESLQMHVAQWADNLWRPSRSFRSWVTCDSSMDPAELQSDDIACQLPLASVLS